MSATIYNITFEFFVFGARNSKGFWSVNYTNGAYLVSEQEAISKYFMSKKEFKSLCQNNNGWYSRTEFAEASKKERHRSNRTGSPLSYIIIELSKDFNAANKVLNKEYYPCLKELIQIISQNTREIDIKNLSDPFKIVILLVDTALAGAQKFIERISKKLCEHFESLNKEAYFDIIQSISISLYPLSQGNDGNEIEATPVVMKSLHLKKMKSENDPLMSKESSGIGMNWKIDGSSNGAIALDAPYLWDIIHDNQIHLIKKFIKRIIDIIGALLGIVLLSPLVMIIAIAIKLTSKGPVFFQQKRIGNKGVAFTFFKFRTMRVDCDDRIHREYVKKLIHGKNDEINLGTKEKPHYKIIEDPRLTATGKFLRKLSLDEIPQFFNVLIGNMSLVGPRPPLPYEVTDYQNWHYRRILEAKPGITGLWQVTGRDSTTFDEMVRIDIHYAENWSLLLDLKILLKTIKMIFFGNGT